MRMNLYRMRTSLNDVISMVEDVKSRLKEFMENEARSGSMDFGCITPLYVYRMWGGDVSLDEIESTLKEVRQAMFN